LSGTSGHCHKRSACERGYGHTLAHGRAVGAFEPAQGEPAVGIEADLRDGLAEREPGSPVVLDPERLARGEDLSHHERAPFHLRHEEPPIVRLEHVAPRWRELAPFRFEEIAPGAALAAAEPCL